MAQDIELLGATYPDVPAVVLPTSGNGTATFYDMNDITYVESINGQSGVVTLTIPPTMTVLSYGHNTWQDFLDAYNSNTIVYCRASSNSNPGTGVQGRMAFMAYLNLSSNGTPTSVEFQYYRSVSSHSASQQGDQVFIYKLESNGTWSVTTREAMSKIAVGTGMASSYSSGTITLSLGAITSDTAAASGDKLIISDASDSSKLKRSGITLGSSTSTFLRNDGTWAEPSGGGGGSVSPYTANPAMDGAASSGSSDDYARGDHVHPTDTSRAASTHVHGDITNGGDITTASVTVASGDCIVINDDSANKIANGPIFGNNTSTFLCNNGTWQTPAGTYSLPTASTSTLGGVKIDGSTITIDGNGVISSVGGGGGASYTKTTCTIPTSGWSNNSITINVTGVTASNDVIVSPAPSSATDWAAAGILCSAQGAGTLTFTRTSANANSLTANIMCFNG